MLSLRMATAANPVVFPPPEKDSPRAGEGGRGGEEQNHREPEDGSEDAAHEVK